MSSGITTVYPPGPDGSGGRYWVLSEKTAELPHVIRYKTDTYAVEFLPVRNDRRGYRAFGLAGTVGAFLAERAVVYTTGIPDFAYQIFASRTLVAGRTPRRHAVRVGGASSKRQR